ncbi:MAG: hypothetical protein IPN72_07515 [Saprospiraceae bacterium]|nr:hypothetical protein [Saprospiraceae bacterium]
MKVNFFIFVFLVVSVITGYGQTDFILFSDLQERFEVKAPGHFKYLEKIIPTVVGDVVNENFSLQKTDHPNTLYTVNVVTYPDAVIDYDSTEVNEEFLLNTLASIAEKNNCQVVYKDILASQEGLPMMVYKLVDKVTKQSIKGVVKLQPNRIYTAQVYSPTGSSLNELIDIFLNSFVVK